MGMATGAWYKQNAIPTLLRSFRCCVPPQYGSDSSSSSSSIITASSSKEHTTSLTSYLPTRTIEIWNTPCIVKKFGKSHLPLGRRLSIRSRTENKHHNDDSPNNMQDSRFANNMTYIETTSTKYVLINPANTNLTGVKQFSYFPLGGPEPIAVPNKDPHHIMGYVRQWGNMNVQNGMVFPNNVIDGIVHELGGWKLQLLLWLLPYRQQYQEQQQQSSRNKDNFGNIGTRKKVKCPVGEAVITKPGGKLLLNEYDSIVHTVPPFYQYCAEFDVGPEQLLSRCYQNSFRISFDDSRKNADNYIFDTKSCVIYCCCPLLGAGCRGFPVDVAIQVAAKESVEWMTTITSSLSRTNNDIPNNYNMNKQREEQPHNILAFGIQDLNVAEALINAIDSKMDSI